MAMIRLLSEKRIPLLAGVLGFVLAVFVVKTWLPSVWGPIRLFLLGLPSTQEVVRDLGPEIRPEFRRICRQSGMAYPPDEVTLIALKQEKLLEVWGREKRKQWEQLTEYQILGSSGTLGPKLRQGDLQVPEGLYAITSLNPNSRFHLSMKLNYPNCFDRKMAEQDGRQNPGDNIFIHGASVSVGCLAMGNDTVEKLFVMAHDTGLANTEVIIVPYDLAESKNINVPEHAPDWTRRLYRNLRENLQTYR